MNKKEITVDGVEYIRVPRFNDYLVSKDGYVRSVDRMIKYSDGRMHKHTGRILKPFINKHGYEIVTLCQNKIKVKKAVHSIVAISFLGKNSSGTEVNHKNLCKTDNRVENLEWVTQKENIEHADKLGVIRHFGIMNGNYRISLH